MSITFDLPAGVEEQLRRDHVNFDGLAKEAALIERYRQGRITRHQLAESLDMTRFEIDEILKQHNVTEDLVTAEEVAEQVATIRRLLLSLAAEKELVSLESAFAKLQQTSFRVRTALLEALLAHDQHRRQRGE